MIHGVPESYAIYDLNRKEQISYIAVASTVTAAITYLFYHNIFMSLLSIFIIFPMQKYYKEFLINKRKRELNNQFRDALYSIAASISVGRQMPEALLEARDNMILIYPEYSPIVLELSQIVERVYFNRESEEDVLRDFAKRSQIEDILNFVDVYFTCRATGGDLEKVVMKASEIIMDKITIYKEIHTLTSQKRFEAKILTIIPLVVILFLQIASPDYLAVMYESIFGRALMTISMISIGMAYYFILKITDIRV